MHHLRIRVLTALLGLLLLGCAVATFAVVSPSYAHPVSNGDHVHCGVILATRIKQPCIPTRHVYDWSLDGVHTSPHVTVGGNWALAYICDGGPGTLYINGRFIQAMQCDNAWHWRVFGRGGGARVWASRRVDVIVLG